ncbi:unnamed protein product [Echinostoma caproni]|uniref:BPTI/Kunitz inhibitor domain-containing protein n=1 Tax=Echinostoma caproni TaxID=27848 RepID=A0A3P8GT77_9TREM|nr:unnamed protein product [Echinostoma caproni]
MLSFWSNPLCVPYLYAEEIKVRCISDLLNRRRHNRRFLCNSSSVPSSISLSIINSNNCFSTERCMLRPDHGLCKAYLTRYAYNCATDECEEFIYGGCGGNRNNFRTRNCSSGCPTGFVDVQTPISYLYPVFLMTRFLLRIVEWLNCRSMHSTLHRQSDVTTASQTSRITLRFVKLFHLVMNVIVHFLQTYFYLGQCLLPRDPGMCLAVIRRWAFNRAKQECEEFIYGGCGGNRNNFGSQFECQYTCMLVSVVLCVWGLIEGASIHLVSSCMSLIDSTGTQCIEQFVHEEETPEET